MEIMIVVAIIGLFVAIGGPAIYRKFNEAKKTNARLVINGFKDAIQHYYDHTYQYPQNLKDLTKDPGVKKWDGPYLEKKAIPKDPWGKTYQYTVTETGKNPYELYSYGGPKGKSEPKKNNINVWEDEE